MIVADHMDWSAYGITISQLVINPLIISGVGPFEIVADILMLALINID